MYAEIENNTIKKIRNRPNWFNGDPNKNESPLTDQELKDNHGILPIVDTKPSFNYLTQKIVKNDQSEWNILEDSVQVTYSIIELTQQEKDEEWNKAVEKKKEKINEERQQKLRKSTVVVNGHEYDTRNETISRILGASIKATIDPNFTVNWITQANSIVTLDANEIIAIGNAMAAQEEDFVFKARQLKDMVDQIPSDQRTQENLDTINWSYFGEE